MSSQDPAAFSGTSLGDDPRQRPLLVEGSDEDFGSVTQAVAGIPEVSLPSTNKVWIACFMLSVSLLGVLGAMLAYLITTGVGVWGNNNPVYWGWPIVNFVFWVGIGHAGTLISAVLFLTRQNWRTGVNLSLIHI